MATIKKHIDETKKYSFPSDARVIPFDSKIIVISAQNINWIVLENKEQLDFFELLQMYSIKNSLERFEGELKDAQYCVMQIEAKRFEERELQRDSNAPFKLHLYLTNECNLRCKHCYMFAGEKEEDEMSTDQIFHLLSEFNSHGGLRVVFSGGEVSVRKDFGSILKHAHGIGLKTLVLTNGVAWSEKMINDLYEHIDEIQISIDGYSEETNASIRGRGVYEKALCTVDRFIQRGVKTSIGCTPIINDSFRHNYRNYVAWGKSLMDKYKGQDFHITFSGDLMDGRDVHISTEERGEMQHIVDEIYEGVYGRSKDDLFVSAMKRGTLNDNCTFGMPTVASNGDVYLCSRVPSLKSIGNVKEDSFDYIMHKCNEAREFSTVDNLQPCQSCELRYICGGDCRIKYFDELRDGVCNVKDGDVHPRRQCTKEWKEQHLALLIRVNERLFQ